MEVCAMIKTRGSKLKLAMTFFMIISACLTGAALAEEQCVKDAWKAFNEKKYQEAITNSDKCIDEFRREAEETQSQLEQKGIPAPPTGKVNDAEKNQIFDHGLLNDVATAYFIKGRSAEFLYREGGAGDATYKKTATDAYNAACSLKYGRAWDPQGWFWSPCEAASKRMPIQ